MRINSILGSLLLIGGNYDDVAVPEQAATEQYNIINFLGGAAPYKQYEGFGISPDTPETCTVEQVQVVARHGERFPSDSGYEYNATINSLKSQNLNGSLAFIKDYQFFVTNPDNFEQETTLQNTDSIFSGSLSAMRDGKTFREKYGHLYNSSEIIPVFSANSDRCYDTGVNFMKGFLGYSYDETMIKYNIISENATSGANSLTPEKSCDNFDHHAFKTSDKLNSYLDDFKQRMASNGNPNLNITVDDMDNLFDTCAYELNVKGYSEFCKLFTSEELIKREYKDDVDLYYNYGPASKYGTTIGSVFVKAAVKLLQDDEDEQEQHDNKIWLAFTHDHDVVNYYSGLGIFNQTIDLDKEAVQFGHSFGKAKIVPQSTRVILEKLNCGGDKYVRFIINDSVVPMKCQYGPGFSCSLTDFLDMMKPITELDFNGACNTTGPNEISFYWDYDQVSYNASLHP